MTSKSTIPRAISLSRDQRTNVWQVTCPSCAHTFSPETTLRSTQYLSCPGKKCGVQLFADYNAEPPQVHIYDPANFKAGAGKQ